MNHPTRTSFKTRAPPLKIKRRPIPPDDAQTLLFNKRIILALICIRVFNVLTITTFFQPDEYYQSLEPAWKLVYGYGETTWEWKEGIRGFLYPSLFASVWWIANAIGIRDANTLVVDCYYNI
jgi:Alg9-like mannosyltransferase family